MITPESVAAAAVDAHERIRSNIRRTPIEHLSAPDDGPSILAKCENLQVTGSFKARGALAALTAASSRRVTSVVTASTGNHGAALAYGARLLGMTVYVFAPSTADHSKLESIRRHGARVELVPGDPVNAELTARAAATRDRPYISPYNDPDVIAGQATIGLELIDQVDEIDTLVASVGGGGLISGIASVVRRRHPALHVVGAVPERSAVMADSVAAGNILDVEAGPTLSDGTAGGIEAGAVTFPLCSELVDTWVRVTEESIRRAIVTHVAEHHQLVEGAAGVALAALADPRVADRAQAGTTVVVLCGANIAPATLAAVLQPVRPAQTDPPR